MDGFTMSIAGNVSGNVAFSLMKTLGRHSETRAWEAPKKRLQYGGLAVYGWGSGRSWEGLE